MINVTIIYRSGISIQLFIEMSYYALKSHFPSKVYNTFKIDSLYFSEKVK